LICGVVFGILLWDDGSTWGNFLTSFSFGRPNASATQFYRDRALRYRLVVNRVKVDHSSSKRELV
ncbi:MAG TPA: hypothetical protein VFD35_03900, partial [Pricia sp.]|nr:hypothetical protein [Pricia sp.]